AGRNGSDRQCLEARQYAGGCRKGHSRGSQGHRHAGHYGRPFGPGNQGAGEVRAQIQRQRASGGTAEIARAADGAKTSCASRKIASNSWNPRNEIVKGGHLAAIKRNKRCMTEFRTGSGSDRVSGTMTRSLPLPVLNSGAPYILALVERSV